MGKGKLKKTKWRSLAITPSPMTESEGPPIHFIDEAQVDDYQEGDQLQMVREDSEPVEHSNTDQSESMFLQETLPWTPHYIPLPSDTPYHTTDPHRRPFMNTQLCSPFSPSVQFIPYYYYYPVYIQPCTSTPIDTDMEVLEKHSEEGEEENTSSVQSSEDYREREKLAKRRKKKKRQSDSEKTIDVVEIDSGYLNGIESSSELSSGYDPKIEMVGVNTGADSDNQSVFKTCSHDNAFPIQFGDVQDIIDVLDNIELNKSDKGNSGELNEKNDINAFEMFENKCGMENDEGVSSQSKSYSIQNLRTDCEKEAKFELNENEVKALENTVQWEIVTTSRKKKKRNQSFDIVVHENGDAQQVELQAKDNDSNLLELGYENKAHDKIEVMQQTCSKEKTATEKCPWRSKKKQKVKENKKTNEKETKGGDLEKMKPLFFEEKAVEIVELVPRIKKKYSGKESRVKHMQDGKLRSKLRKNVPKLKVPVLLPPSKTHEYSCLPKSPSQEPCNTEQSSTKPNLTYRTISKPNPVTCMAIGLSLLQKPVSDETYLVQVMEEELLRQEMIPMSKMQNKQSQNKVIIVRDKFIQKQTKTKPHENFCVPGPRLKYSQGCGAGPLSVSRTMAPPLSLVQNIISVS